MLIRAGSAFVALVCLASAAHSQELSCEGLANVLAAAPSFSKFRTSDNSGAAPDGTGVWETTYNPDGAICSVTITHNRGDNPDEYMCQWDFKTNPAYQKEISKISKMLRSCPQWTISRTVSSSANDHELWTAGDEYEFNVFWDPDLTSTDNIQLEIWRGVDRRANDKFLKENGE